MLPSPSSSPRVIFEDRLNLTDTPPKKLFPQLPTPPKEGSVSRKRSAKRHTQENARKRTKIRVPVDEDVEEEKEEDSCSSEESDSEPDVGAFPPSRRRPRGTHHTISAFSSVSAHLNRRLEISTRPILQTLVSSLKTDIYACQSLDDRDFLTPPYACSYSHSAKYGGLPLLAVATEQGTVQILNTSRREPWDPEPTRIILQPHRNGIFGVKWDRTDTQIATCSGDQSTRITSVETNTITHILHGHTDTVKTVTWDPTNDALLATGGRDGAICIWDLRMSTTRLKEGIAVVNPVTVISEAHEDITKSRVRRGKKHILKPRAVTGLVCPEGVSYGVVSSGAFDGILRFWDLRKPEKPRQSRSSKSKSQLPSILYSSPYDPTMLHGSKRARGIISLAQGSGPTAGLIFGVGKDSRIHTYALPTLAAHPIDFADDRMQASSFYIGLALSPCGKWLACGASSPKSSNFVFEVSGAGRLGGRVEAGHAVELQGHTREVDGEEKGEVGAVDWADGMLATCADDGTVRVWRPDIDVYQQCQADPGERKWEWCWSKQTV